MTLIIQSHFNDLSYKYIGLQGYAPPIALLNYSHMRIWLQEEIIGEDIQINDLLIICLTMVAKCEYDYKYG